MLLKAIKYLTQQGLVIRNGYHEEKGHLPQLLLTWSEDNECIKNWIKEDRFTSHQAVNEQISIMGQGVLRNLLLEIKKKQKGKVCPPKQSMPKTVFEFSLRLIIP